MLELFTPESPTTKPGPLFQENSGLSNDLPMVVWLQGNEIYASDFSLDADQAMIRLGIKRSRLNQISGRELRVGKARVDRYIKPFYREVDVEDYFSWTRATATHKKSSQEIEHASKKLEGHAEEIVGRLSNYTEEVSERIQQQQIGNFKEYQKITHDFFHYKINLLEKKVGSHLDFIEKNFRKQQQQQNQFFATLESLQESLSLIPILHKQMSELMLQNAYQNKLTLDLIAQQQELIKEWADEKQKTVLTSRRPYAKSPITGQLNFKIFPEGDKPEKPNYFSQKQSSSGFPPRAIVWEERF